jgi:hypothetical protein
MGRGTIYLYCQMMSLKSVTKPLSLNQRELGCGAMCA